MVRFRHIFPILVKEAASLSTLAAGAKRLSKVVKAPSRMALGPGEVGAGAGTLPFKTFRSGAKNIAKGIVPEAQLSSYIENFNGPWRGNIYIPKGGSYRAMKNNPMLQDTVPALSGQGQHGFNTVTRLHEGFERAVTPTSMLSYGTGHMSPDVLLKEHNLLAKMTGKGAEETRGAFQSIRSGVGESNLVKSNLIDAYGPRFNNFQYGQGEKIPKAMRKDLTKKLKAKAQDQMRAQLVTNQ